MHEMVLRITNGNKFKLTCRCLATGTGKHRIRAAPIEVRAWAFPAAEAIAAHRTWHAMRGIEIP